MIKKISKIIFVNTNNKEHSEAELNQWLAKGWKIEAASGASVILTKEVDDGTPSCHCGRPLIEGECTLHGTSMINVK